MILTEPGAAISISDLAFAWPGRDAFGFSVDALRIERGETVCLFGPSGSGKSTLLSLICGVLRPRSGRLEVLGQDLAKLSNMACDRYRAEHIGVIFQQFNLLPYGTIFDNITLPLAFAPMRRARIANGENAVEGEVERLLSALDLEGVDTRRAAMQLSIGQQQRVAVARALIGAPEIVIADEPTSALDRKAQDRFLDLMMAQLAATKATLLMVSHDERLIDRFDRVIQLGDLIVPNHHATSAAKVSA